MNCLKHYFGFYFSLFFLFFLCSSASAKTDTSLKLTTLTSDTVNVFASSANGSVGDIISLNIPVSNFNGVSNISFSINWNGALLQFQSFNNFNLPGLTSSNFDMSQSSTGGLGFSWSGSPLTLPDGTIIFTLQFLIKASSGVPTPISFSDFPTQIKCIKDVGASYIRVNSGQVNITNTCSSRPPGLRCANAPLLCPRELPYCGTLPTSNTQDDPRLGCGSIENNVWIAFEAATPDLLFRIKVANCNGTAGDGIQVRIFQTTNCANYALLACKFQIPRTAMQDTLEVHNLIPGNRYYLMIDGYGGDICDFKILLESGSLVDYSYVTPDFNGNFSVCPNQKNITFSVNQPLGIESYEWKIPSTVNANTALSGTSIKVDWGNVSDSVCVRNIGRCDTSNWICKSVSFMPPVKSDFSAQKCKKGCYTFNGQSYCTAGDYPVTLKTPQGCDSIVTLHLTDLPPITYTLNATTCSGVPYVYNGSSLTTTGDYPFTLTTAQGCDSIVTLHLTVQDTLRSNFSAVICPSGTYSYKGNAYAAGDYSVKLKTAQGCDSIVALHISVSDTLRGSLNASFCKGTCFNYNGQTYCNAGDYSVKLKTPQGCDSIVALHVSVSDTLRGTLNASFCKGTCFDYNGQTYCNAGDYSVKLKTAQGCDSVVALHLTVTQTLTSNLDTTVCTGKTIIYNGKTYSTPGDYTVSYTTPQGCDSIVTLRLRNYAPASSSFDTVLCLGTNFIYRGQTYTTAGSYTRILSGIALHGCDSTVTFNLLYIDPSVNVTSSGDISCTSPNATLTAVKSMNFQGSTVQYIWKDATGNTFGGNSNTVTVTQSGTFALTVKTTYKNTNCTSNPVSVTVNRIGNLPAKPVIQLTNNSGNPTSGLKICQNQNFNAAASSSTADVSSYAWTISNGGSFSTPVNTSTVTASVSSPSVQLCVQAINGCGQSDSACTLIIPVTPPSLPTINGATSVCPNSKAVYSIANPVNGVVYTWTATNGTINGSASDVKNVEVVWANAIGKICVTASNTCFSSQPSCLDVNIKNTVPDSVPITGITSLCSNDTTIYNVNADNSVIQINWTVPTGATILSGVGTKTIRVIWRGSIAGKISVDLLNDCQLKRTISLPVIVKDASINAPNITGSQVTCPGSTTSYSIPPQKNVTYKWRIPNSATALTRLDSNAIQIQWSNVSGDVCIDVMNDCQVKKSICTTIQVKSSIDSLPITGDASVCADSIGHYSVQNDVNARYFWRLPAGASFVSGRGTNNIVVRFPKGSGGKVLCIPNGGCADGNPSSIFVTLRDAPIINGVISGKTTVCVGDTAHYNITSVLNATGYLWRASDGVSFLSNQNTQQVDVVFTKAQTVQLCLAAVGDCSPGTEKCLTINVNNQPQPFAGNDTSICATQFRLNARSTGGKLKWSVLLKPDNASVSFSSTTDALPIITVSQPGVYDFLLQESNSACSNTSKIQVTVTQPPEISLSVAQCSADASQFQVSFNITSNGANNFYSVKGSTTGVLTGNQFNSNPIIQNSNYWFVVNDNTGCISDTLRGSQKCDCITKAPTISTSGNNTFCYGTTLQVIKQNDGQYSSGDVSEYLLHDGSNSNISSIKARNSIGIFSFDSSKMQYGHTYYVVLVVGQPAADGTVNLVKRCSSVSNSIAVTFKDKIIAHISGDTMICSNTNAKIFFSVNAPGTYSGNSVSALETFNFKNLTENDILNVNPTLAGTFKLSNFTDADNCAIICSDSVKIGIRPFPTANAGLDQTICIREALLTGNSGKDFIGKWTSLTSGPVITTDSLPNTTVGHLLNGKNTFVWSVNDKVCPAYQARANVNIYLALVPKANKLGIETFAGDTVVANLIEATPPGTFTIRRLTEPAFGRFDYFSDGKFNFMTDSSASGIVKFQFLACSASCNNLCDTGDVRILVKKRTQTIDTISNIITVPNAITPNGDGKNDYFVVEGVEKYPGNELIVFNRWGDIVYRSKPYNNDWSGNNQSGLPLPEGTYYYVLRLNINDGKVLKGDVTILK